MPLDHHLLPAAHSIHFFIDTITPSEEGPPVRLQMQMPFLRTGKKQREQRGICKHECWLSLVKKQLETPKRTPRRQVLLYSTRLPSTNSSPSRAGMHAVAHPRC